MVRRQQLTALVVSQYAHAVQVRVDTEDAVHGVVIKFVASQQIRLPGPIDIPMRQFLQSIGTVISISRTQAGIAATEVLKAVDQRELTQRIVLDIDPFIGHSMRSGSSLLSLIDPRNPIQVIIIPRREVIRCDRRARDQVRRLRQAIPHRIVSPIQRDARCQADAVEILRFIGDSVELIVGKTVAPRRIAGRGQPAGRVEANH